MESTGINTSDIIAICASIIAVSALATSVFQSYMTRKHNHLSLRPHLNLMLRRAGGSAVACFMTNDGIGPAFIQSYEIRCDGRKHEIVNYNDCKTVFSQIGINFDKVSHYVNTFNTGTSLAPDKILRLFEFPDTKHDEAHHALVKKSLHQLELIIKYKCIYGNEFELCEKL